MHRLRTKKKEPKTIEVGGEEQKPSSKKLVFKRNKSQPPPTSRPQVDITAALPTNDDFRISLMMPNLEQRFSVLREAERNRERANAEGPGVHGMGYGALASGKLFKSDSGSNEDFSRPPYGNAGLSDISEIASIRSGLRTADGPPDSPSQASHSDESYAGSIMSRPRQGDSNVLFGGRQKVYRINTAASRSADDVNDSPVSPIGRGRMGGRALYTDDLPGVNGAKDWRKEKDRVEIGDISSDKASSRPSSPSPANYNRDRNTNSSTMSGPSSLTRSSTAATSNSSQSRNFTPNTSSHSVVATASNKPRKLIYEQALDRDMNEQNALANQRLDIIAQRRAGSTSPNPYSEDNDRARAISPSSHTDTRPFSPFGYREAEQHERSVSPSALDLSAGIETLRNRFPGANATEKPRGILPSIAPNSSVVVPFSFGFENSTSRQTPSLQANSINGLPTPRSESDEFHSNQTQRPTTKPYNEPTPNASPFIGQTLRQSHSPQKSESTIREPNNGSSPILKTSSPSETSNFDEPLVQQTTFFEAGSDSEPDMDDAGSSDYGDDTDISLDQLQDYHRPCQQPMAKLQDATIEIIDEHAPHEHIQSFQPGSIPITAPTSVYQEESELEASDSPTLPPHPGLSSLIRQHLRSDSGISSIYAPSTFRKMSEPFSDHSPVLHSANAWDNQYVDYDEEAPFQPENDPFEQRPRYTLAQLKKKNEGNRKDFEQEPDVQNAPIDGADELHDDSDAQEEWRNRLAEKRKAVQQKLHEHSGRNSPAPGFNTSSDDLSKEGLVKTGPMSSILRPKGSLNAGNQGREDSKAIKMLGISPVLSQSKDSFRKKSDEELQQRLNEPGPQQVLRSHRIPGPPPAQLRPRGHPLSPGQQLQNHPYSPPHGYPGGLPTNGPRHPIPMNQPAPMNGHIRRGPGHIPIEAGMPASANLHREWMEQGRSGVVADAARHFGSMRMPNGQHNFGQQGDFRPPHDRTPQHSAGRQRAKSTTQQPPEMSRNHPLPIKAPVRRGPPSEEELRGRQRIPRHHGMPNMAASVITTTVTSEHRPHVMTSNSEPAPKPMSNVNQPVPPTIKRRETSPAAAKTSLTGSPPRDQDLSATNLVPNENVQSRFSTDEPPVTSSFVGRFRSNSKGAKQSSTGMFDPTSAQPSLPSSSANPGFGTSGFKSAKVPNAVAEASILSEVPGSSSTVHAFQSAGPAADARIGKKSKVKKTDISEPKLLHTTSQMPTSNLIEAGGKQHPKILPPGLTDSPPLRQRSGSDGMTSNAGEPIVSGPQRTSDPQSNGKPRVLRKATSHGSGLRNRGMSQSSHGSRSNATISDSQSSVYQDSTPFEPPTRFDITAPAGMI